MTRGSFLRSVGKHMPFEMVGPAEYTLDAFRIGALPAILVWSCSMQVPTPVADSFRPAHGFSRMWSDVGICEIENTAVRLRSRPRTRRSRFPTGDGYAVSAPLERVEIRFKHGQVVIRRKRAWARQRAI